MENNLYEKFNKLGLNDKRNEFNQEMIKLFQLVMQTSNIKGCKNIEAKIINYNMINDKNISEDEYLFYQYQNLINIRKIIINYISWNK